MIAQSYTTSILVSETKLRTFNSINEVSKWWTENVEGKSNKLDEVFTVKFGATWKKFKIIEFNPNNKVVWEVIDCFMPWNNDKTEWTGTKINFELQAEGDQTKITFTHIGLIPEIECYNACSNAWGGYLQNSLKNFINTGIGKPEPKEKDKF